MVEYVGLDVSKEETSYCVMDGSGKVLARGLRRRGLPVEVIDARRAHAVMSLQHNKTDGNDAELLAELARTGFYQSVAVKSEAAQLGRMLSRWCTTRRQLVWRAAVS